MCHVLNVTPSAYYTWRKRPRRQRIGEERKLLLHIRSIHQESDRTYGSPRICRHLREHGMRIGENRIARLMRLHEIKPKQVKRFRVTTEANHGLPVAENKLNRSFEIARPNAVWAADITYVWTREGWLYLAVVLDLFSRRIIGWSMKKSLDRTLVLDAMQMALSNRRPGPGLLHHSDRGSQYASGAYQGLLADHGIQCSMSRKGNCWDNAPMESFFSTLKREVVHHRRYVSREEARQDIFKYMETWYNRKRQHSSLDYLSPCEYEARYAVQHHSLAA